MHKTLGQRDPAAAFPLTRIRDDADERRQANRAIAVSAIGLGVTGLVELLIAVVTGSVGLLGAAKHHLGIGATMFDAGPAHGRLRAAIVLAHVEAIRGTRTSTTGTPTCLSRRTWPPPSRRQR